ncbi:MAG: ornithine carbamoyltransferase [Chthonomonadales bacterium]|nr:ornithine carbamoyltransferase [Chthonomonadales bacterium]
MGQDSTNEGRTTPSPTWAAVRYDSLELRGRSLISIADLDAHQVTGVLDLAAALKGARGTGAAPLWNGTRSLAMIFEKPSLRTRVTFELGMRELGGIPIVLGPTEIGLGKRESVADVARNLGRWVSAIMARVYDHSALVEMRDNCAIPVINALSDVEHPCQTLADLLTIRERLGRLDGVRIAWVGDGNNVAHSLMLGAALTGASVIAACPTGYEPDAAIVEKARSLAHDPGAIRVTGNPYEAVADADVVYTDVWASMGQEAEASQRKAVFAPYQVNADLMRRAGARAIFLHCLPAHRGEEVTDEVLDGPQSAALDQAENRLHAQKAVLALLIGP